jgi:hypothetical protein
MTSPGLPPGKVIWETFAVASIGGPWRHGPRADYTSADTARHALERHLRGWELWAELTNSIRVEFRYKSAQVVDRQSAPDSVSVAAHAELAEVGMAELLPAQAGRGQVTQGGAALSHFALDLTGLSALVAPTSGCGSFVPMWTR